MRMEAAPYSALRAIISVFSLTTSLFFAKNEEAIRGNHQPNVQDVDFF